MGALGGALAAAHAAAGLHLGLALGVLLHLPPAGAAAHAQVLDGAAEAGLLVALEVGQGDHHVRLHDGLADLGGLDVLRPRHGHLHVVVAPQAVADDHLAARGQGGEAVFIGGVQVLQGVLPPAGVEGVAVGEEGDAPQLLHHVGHRLGVVGPQERQVPRLAEVHLDGHQLVVKIDLPDARPADELFQLVQQAHARTAPEVGVVDLRLF